MSRLRLPLWAAVVALSLCAPAQAAISSQPWGVTVLVPGQTFHEITEFRFSIASKPRARQPQL